MPDGLIAEYPVILLHRHKGYIKDRYSGKHRVNTLRPSFRL